MEEETKAPIDAVSSHGYDYQRVGTSDAEIWSVAFSVAR